MSEDNPPPAEGSAMHRRSFIKTVGKKLGLAAAGAVVADQSTAGNRHVDTPGMRAAGAAIGAVSMVALGHAISKSPKSGEDDKSR